MTIPNDSLNRWWIDATSVNPELINSLRPSLVAFLAFDHGRVPSLQGSGFIIAGMPDFAIVISAKHVLLEGVFGIQRPVPTYSPSALFVPDSAITPSLAPELLKTIWMGSEDAGLLNVDFASYNDTLDIKSCVVRPQDMHATPFHSLSIPIDTSMPSAGDVIHMVSLNGMEFVETEPPVDKSGIGQRISITCPTSLRVGVVTAVYPEGFRQYRWPCFTTSIPAEPGMSGGFVYLPRDGKTIAACGVVCADNSTGESRIDNNHCGESVIGCTWPALGLRVPRTVPSTDSTSTSTIYELMRAGDMDIAVGGIEHIEIVELNENGYRIRFRDDPS